MSTFEFTLISVGVLFFHLSKNTPKITRNMNSFFDTINTQHGSSLFIQGKQNERVTHSIEIWKRNELVIHIIVNNRK